MDERFEKDGEGGTERGRSPNGGVEEDVVKVRVARVARSGRGRLRAGKGASRLESSAAPSQAFPPAPPLKPISLGG